MSDELLVVGAILAIGLAAFLTHRLRSKKRMTVRVESGQVLRQAVARARNNVGQIVGRYAVVTKVISVGAIDLDPGNLAIWIFVSTDAERDRLDSDPEIKKQLRSAVETAGYPAHAISRVGFAFESDAYVQHHFAGDYWRAMR